MLVLDRRRVRPLRRESDLLTRVYIASPLGFTEAGRVFQSDHLIPAITRAGLTPVDPWSLVPQSRIAAVQALPDGPAKREAWTRLGHEIGETNRRALDQADAVVAVLDGADVDSGTAAEIGYAFARGLRIVGYRSDLRRAGEHDGAVVNLQVEYFIRRSGGTIVGALDDLPAALTGVRV